MVTTMEYVILWFILAGGAGYLEPLTVQPPMMSCGLAGAVVGVQVDRLANPTKVSWPDPYFPGVHCDVDIRAKVATLKPGEYHAATTIVSKPCCVPIAPPASYINHDPHTSPTFVIGNLSHPPAPASVGISGTGMQLPAARTLSWDANTEPEVVGYIAYKDGVAYPQTSATHQAVSLTAYATYHFAVRAVANDGGMSDPATLDYTLEAPPPPPPPQCSGITIRVDDWSRTVAIGGRGKVALTLLADRAIVLLQVRLGGQVIGEVTGADLRDLAGLYFSVPRVAGSYNITVAVKDSTNCTTQTSAVRTVTVS